jgi:hypothetical protein
MKKRYSYAIAFIAFFYGTSLYSQNAKSTPNYNLMGTYSTYTTALGKGKGVIFRISISNKENKPFTVDSFYVNNTPMKFRMVHTSIGEIVESNYLVNIPEPSLNVDGTTSITSKVEDQIITKNKFYPSWLIIKQAGKKIKIKVDKYSEIKQPY